MLDLIYRKAVLDDINLYIDYFENVAEPIERDAKEVLQIIKAAVETTPAASSDDVHSLFTGWWILRGEQGGYECSQCGKKVEHKSLFCPHCGKAIGDSILIIPDNAEPNASNESEALLRCEDEE